VGDPNYTPGETTGTFIWVDGTGIWHVRGTLLPDDPNENFSGILTTDGMFFNVTLHTESPGAQALVGGEAFIDPHAGVSGSCCSMVIESSPVPSRLYQNQGDGTFVDVAASANIADVYTGEAALWADLNNDGFIDLYVVRTGDLYNEPNRLYMNNGDGTFTDMAATFGAEADVSGRGENAAYGDFNNDGFLDLLVTNGLGSAPFNYGKHTLLRNEGNSNHWLKLRLVGTASNRDAIGSHITVSAGTMTQMRQYAGNVRKCAQDGPFVHFGLGESDTVELLTVTWPGGIVQELYGITADQTLIITEPSIELTTVPVSTDLHPGDQLEYTLTAKNVSHRSLRVELWEGVTLPNGSDRTYGARRVTLQPNDALTRNRSLNIPTNAPSGSYTLHLFIGDSSVPWIWGSDSFDFTVSPQ
jgi:hypothetical protein